MLVASNLIVLVGFVASDIANFLCGTLYVRTNVCVMASEIISLYVHLFAMQVSYCLLVPWLYTLYLGVGLVMTENSSVYFHPRLTTSGVLVPSRNT